MSRTYWRSLSQVEERPEFRDALEREFPEGASELPEGITRRDMVMLLGASLSFSTSRWQFMQVCVGGTFATAEISTEA